MVIETVIAAEKISAAKQFWERLSPKLKEHISTKIKKVYVSFHAYLGDTYERNKYVSLLCSRSMPSQLKDVYVETLFNCKTRDNEQISDRGIISDIRDNQRVIIRGNGGSGKTLFLKKLWNDIFNEPEGRIPVFVELRKFNHFDTADIKVLIRHSLAVKGELSESLFHDIAKDGTFIFVFDGFDEVALDKREALEKQLLELELQYRECGFVVSSRPSETFSGWSRFQIFDVKPFNREQILELIDKTPVARTTKTSFSKVLSKSFFKKHQEFLSSPLLALMMLITFRSKADIPDNLNEFYENAFQALFSEHDATKDSFKRPHFLSITEFKRIFACFCMFTYYENKFEFKEAEFVSFIEKAKSFINLNCSPSARIECSTGELIHEFVEAVNLVQKDGMDYLFIHRSFQEYFAAYFVIHVDTKKTAELLNLFANRTQDSSLSIAYEMNPSIVEEQYILKQCDAFIKQGVLLQKPPKPKKKYEYVALHEISFYWRQRRAAKSNKNNRMVINKYPNMYFADITRFGFVLDHLLFDGKMMDPVRDIWANFSEAASVIVRPAQDNLPISDLLVALRLTVDYEDYAFTPLVRNANDPDTELGSESVFIKIRKPSELEARLIDLNQALKTVNKRIVKLHRDINSNHQKREKSLDDMFFET